MDMQQVNQALFRFLEESPNPLFAVRSTEKALQAAGFAKLREEDAWEIREGGAYYTTRSGSSLIAFRVPKKDFTGFQIMASHCDSPVFKIKPDAEITVDKRYVKLDTEVYGGMLFTTWLDRPLSVAGRVVVETDTGIESKLINIDRDLLVIPNLAIHMNRGANDGYQYNAQTDLLPLFCEVTEEDQTNGKPVCKAAPEEIIPEKTGEEDSEPVHSIRGSGTSGKFLRLIADEAGVRPEQILDLDLFLYNRMKPAQTGLNGEFICAGRLDDLQCAFASLQGMLAAKPEESVAVHCMFDKEEVGNGGRQGAASTFLKDVLRRICIACGKDETGYQRSLASSFLVSADNAHGVHPNHPEKADPVNRPYINRGIVIKYSASQKYTTDAVAGAIFRSVCKTAGVPYQVFANRSDMPGGTTLGNIAQNQVPVCTADIGLAQLAMHSAYETAGARDTAYLAEAARVLFSGSVQKEGDGRYTLHF